MNEVLLIQINGNPYGILKRQIAGPCELASEHWLSDSTGPAAGLTVVDDRTVTLFDLGGCIGLEQTFNPLEPCYYCSASAGQDIAFVVPGPVESDWLASDAVLPLPDVVRTPLIHSCGILSSGPVPLVDIDSLHARVSASVFEAPEPETASPDRSGHNGNSEAPIHLLEIGEEPFAVALEDVQTPIGNPERIVVPPYLPSGVSGLVLHEDEILPLVSPVGLPGADRPGSPMQMVVGRVGGRKLGLLVDRVIDTLEPGAAPVHPLPPLARSKGFLSALLWKEDIFPLIDLSSILGQTSNEDRIDPPVPESDSGGKVRLYLDGTDLDIIELDFGGFRCALPASDVKSAFPARSYRRLPVSRPAVAGVARHQDVLWPVVDPGVCFGSNRVEAASRMVHFESEDFKALVLAGDETIERRLTPEMQHALPFHQHHGMVHCCYPDDGAVRLVLNIPALAEHFDGSCALQITDSREIRTDLAAASNAESLCENRSGEANRKRFERAGRRKREASVASFSDATRFKPPDAGLEAVGQRTDAAETAIRSDRYALSERVTDGIGKEGSPPIAQAPAAKPPTPVAADIECTTHPSPLEAHCPEPPEAHDTQAVPAYDRSPEPNDPENEEISQLLDDPPESIPVDASAEIGDRRGETPLAPDPPGAVSSVLDTDDGWRTTDPDPIDDVVFDDGESVESFDTDAEEVPLTATDTHPMPAARTRRLDSGGDSLLSRADRANVAETHGSAIDGRIPELTAAQDSGLIRRLGPVSKISGVTLAVLLFGAVVFYWYGDSPQPTEAPSARKVVTVPIVYGSSGDAETASAALGLNDPKAEISQTGFNDTFWSDIRNTQQDTASYSEIKRTREELGAFESTRSSERSPASEVITVSTSPSSNVLPPKPDAGSRAQGVTHRVSQGDTLWEISERYTGSAWNFPKLARDNAIRNPNIIFPDQQIVVYDP